MNVTMTAKNQITIPKKIAKVLHLKKGTMFRVKIQNNRIELVPLEVKEMEFSMEMYEKLEDISKEEQGKERKVTEGYIENLKKGKI